MVVAHPVGLLVGAALATWGLIAFVLHRAAWETHPDRERQRGLFGNRHQAERTARIRRRLDRCPPPAP